MRLNHQVSAVTERLLVGPFLVPARASYLRELGVTHVLNVGEAPSFLSPADTGFLEIRDLAVTDLALIPDDVAVECLNALHEMLQTIGSKVYVHCIAGQNRSPTIVWLYLIACGMPRQEAKELIESAAADAIPGHKSLVNDRLALLAEDYGRSHFQAPIGDERLSPP